MPRRVYGKVDAVQHEIVTFLRKFGCSVQSLASVGEGCPDLLIGYRRVNYLAECKTPGGRHRAKQGEWAESWAGGPVLLLRSVEEAERWLLHFAICSRN